MKSNLHTEDFKLITEAVLESSLAGYWDWNMISNYEYLSPRFKEMLGYSEDEMENSPEAWQKIAFKEDLPAMFSAFEAHIASKGKLPFEAIVRYNHKNGSTIWVQCKGKIVEWSNDGHPRRAIGCHIDITESKLLEESLTNLLKEKNTLLKEVHHRVKNNLQLLLSISRLKNKDGKIESTEIEDSIKSIAKAYEAIYQTNSFSSVLIDEYIKHVLDSITSYNTLNINFNSAAIECSIDFLIPIGLIISELVHNSIKHNDNVADKLKVQIEIELIDKNIRVHYADNGKGYVKLPDMNVETDSFGLVIIDGLVKQLDGEIKFFNEKGANAEIKIPISSSL